MFAIIIITAFTVVFTVFNYGSFMPAVHHMSQSLYENTVHRWHVQASIGANTNNFKLNQVVQTFNASSANATLNGTAPTNPIKNETVQATASTNKLYSIEVSQVDFDMCSKATINFNDIIPRKAVMNEAVIEKKPEVTRKSKSEAVNEKKPEVTRKSKNETGKQLKSPFNINVSSIFISVVITAIGVDLLCRYGPNKSSTTNKSLEEKESIDEKVKSITEEEKSSTEEEKEPFDFKQQYAQEMYPHIDAISSSENSPLECLSQSTPPSDNSSILSLKEAPATPPSGFVEPELPRVHLSDHASSIGLVDGSQHSTHSLSGEEDVYKAGPVTPANVLVEVTTGSTETPEDKSNCAQAEPAITAIEKKPTTHSEPVDLAVKMPEEKPNHTTYSEPADLVVEVKADSIDTVERRRHSQSSLSDESTNFTNTNSSETNALVEEVEPKESEKVKENRSLSNSYDLITIENPRCHIAGKLAKVRNYLLHDEILRLYHKRETEVINYAELVDDSTYQDLKTGKMCGTIENDLKELVASVSHWFPFESLKKAEMEELQVKLRSYVKSGALPHHLFDCDDHFYVLVVLSCYLREQVHFLLKLLDRIRNSAHSDKSPSAIRDKINLAQLLSMLQNTVQRLNKGEHYRYKDFARTLIRLK